MVPNTSELLPDPDTPVNTVNRRLGISTLTSLRLLTRAPCTRITSWLSAACAAADRRRARSLRRWAGAGLLVTGLIMARRARRCLAPADADHAVPGHQLAQARHLHDRLGPWPVPGLDRGDLELGV